MADADSIAALADALVVELTAAGQTVATAESCTGGWIAKAITDVAGSSAAFGYGMVSYSNAAKNSMLGVRSDTLSEHGAVSEAVVREMAVGAIAASGADLAVAVSGIAGPDGGSDDKPVGTVWLAWAVMTSNGISVDVDQRLFAGDRETIRSQSVILALQGLRERLRKRG